MVRVLDGVEAEHLGPAGDGDSCDVRVDEHVSARAA